MLALGGYLYWELPLQLHRIELNLHEGSIMRRDYIYYRLLKSYQGLNILPVAV